MRNAPMRLNNPLKNPMRWIALLAAVLLIAAACGDDDDASGGDASQTPATTAGAAADTDDTDDTATDDPATDTDDTDTDDTATDTDDTATDTDDTATDDTAMDTDDTAMDTDDTAMPGAAPTSELCGDEPIRMAHIDGFGANTWRQITAAELRDEMSACPNVTVEYTQADFDLPIFISAINSFVAQGFDAIVVYDDFGNQALDALRSAYEAGVVVVPYIADPSGVDGEDYTKFIPMNTPVASAIWAEWFHEVLDGEGELIFVGGIPGNPSSLGAMSGFEAKAEELGGGLTFLNDEPIDTNWDPAEAQRVMAGTLTQYGDQMQGVVSDYGVASVGGIRSMITANYPIPPLATYASSNELGCVYQELVADNPDFELLSIDGTTQVVRLAGRLALSELSGVPTGDPDVFELFTFMDTMNNLEPPCEPDLPPDADLSSALSTDQLKELFE